VTTPRHATPRAALLALALAAPLWPAPAPAAEVPLPPPPPGTRLLPSRAAWLAVSAGPFAATDQGSSAALTVDYGFASALQPVAGADLEWHLLVVGAAPGYDAALTATAPAFPGGPAVTTVVGTTERNAWVVQVAPTARLRRALAPGLAVFADGGLGLGLAWDETVDDQAFVGRTTTRRATVGLLLRLGAGVAWDATERLRLVFHPVAVSVELGSDWSAFTPSFGLAFRL
jgi:hypothetical protein